MICEEIIMKNLRMITIIFKVFILCAAIYIFYTGANAGIVVIPILFFLLFQHLGNPTQNKDK